MKLVNLWRNSIFNHINLLNEKKRIHTILQKEKNNKPKLLALPIKTAIINIINPIITIKSINSSHSCDLCGVEISKYDWIYRCDTYIFNQNFICLSCIYNLINQHYELHKLLINNLNNHLYADCIELIATFVCGSVVHFE